MFSITINERIFGHLEIPYHKNYMISHELILGDLLDNLDCLIKIC